MKKISYFLILVMLIIVFSNCSDTEVKNNNIKISEKYDTISEEDAKHVTILMNDGNENANKFIDVYVTKELKEKYDIDIKRVVLNEDEFFEKLEKEKKSEKKRGSADLICLNGNNFKRAKDGELLFGPIYEKLESQKKYYNSKSKDLNLDMGIEIDGYEAVWGKSQLVLSYDSRRLYGVRDSYAAILALAKQYPGRVAYTDVSKSDVGAAFVRNAYFELIKEKDNLKKEMSKEDFIKMSKPVIDYFKELNPYLWENGKKYPASYKQMDELFIKGSLLISMTLDIGGNIKKVKDGEYPNTVKSMMIKSGSIGNAHYLAIPFNAVNKNGAIKTIDLLQSPEAQIEKYKPDVWGDLPAFDVKKLNDEQKKLLSAIDIGPAGISLDVLEAKRVPELRADYIQWVNELWETEIKGK